MLRQGYNYHSSSTVTDTIDSQVVAKFLRLKKRSGEEGTVSMLGWYGMGDGKHHCTTFVFHSIPFIYFFLSNILHHILLHHCYPAPSVEGVGRVYYYYTYCPFNTQYIHSSFPSGEVRKYSSRDGMGVMLIWGSGNVGGG